MLGGSYAPEVALCELLSSHLLITLLIIQKRGMSELCVRGKRLDITLVAEYSGVSECSSWCLVCPVQWPGCLVSGLADQCLMVLMIKN